MKGLADCSDAIAARFCERVEPEPNSGCWLWLGAMVDDVHPVITVARGSYVRASAARVSYEMAKGAVPPQHVISRRCGNVFCVNPDHLFSRIKNVLLTGEAAFRGKPTGVITHQRLLELLSYDPDEGIFRWKQRRNQLSPIGKIADRNEWFGRKTIYVDGRIYKSHRLAWFYVNGKWPECYIDHINNNAGDNRIANLREATPLQNSQNARRPSHNKSGYKGVFFSAVDRKWFARIRVNKRTKHIGSYPTAEGAYEAYCNAAKQFHREFARIE